MNATAFSFCSISLFFHSVSLRNFLKWVSSSIPFPFLGISFVHPFIFLFSSSFSLYYLSFVLISLSILSFSLHVQCICNIIYIIYMKVVFVSPSKVFFYLSLGSSLSFSSLIGFEQL